MKIARLQAGDLTLSRDPANGFLLGSVLASAADSLSYNQYGEVTSYQASYSGSSIFDVQYTRDDLGRITQKVETVEGVSTTYDYSYDTAGRLITVTKNGSLVSEYVYDANGNRVRATVNGATSQGFYDLQDRMTSCGGATYTYTPNGELKTKTDSSGVTSYKYDEFGNLVKATLPDGTIVEYVIDGNNRRVGKKVDGALVQGFLYKDQLNPIAEFDGTGAVVARFIYGEKFNVPDYMIKGGVTYRIISDHLGSPRLVINTTDGYVAQQIDYDEFGNIIADTNPGFQPFAFAGGIYDQHTKLTRFGARDYSAEIGRWTSKDPIEFAGGDANLYMYVLGDPINYRDSSGFYTDEAEFRSSNPANPRVAPPLPSCRDRGECRYGEELNTDCFAQCIAKYLDQFFIGGLAGAAMLRLGHPYLGCIALATDIHAIYRLCYLNCLECKEKPGGCKNH